MPGQPYTDARYPWVAMGVVLIGTFMVILDTTIVNVALPEMAVDLDAPTGVEWVVTGYLLAVGMVQPATGWLADRFGRKPVFLLSLGLFAVGSLLAAVSVNLGFLVASRFAQGLGGGAIMPVGLAMIYELFPTHRRGSALGVWGIAAMAAPALGPVVGGYLVTAVGWRWLFLINVPIGAIGIGSGIRLLRDVGYRERRSFDLPGLVLAVGALSLLLLTLSRSAEIGVASLWTVGGLVVGLFLLWGFVRVERRREHPLIDMTMFTSSTFSLTIGIVWLITLAQFARLVFIPLELIGIRGFSALDVGLMLTPAALATASTMPIGGRLADRVGPRIPVTLGLALIALGVFFQSMFAVDTAVWAMITAFCIQGLGTGLAMMPNTLAAMDSVTANLVAQASSVRSLNRQIAGALSVAVLTSVVVARLGVLEASGSDPQLAQQAYNQVFLIATFSAAAAFVASFWLPGKEETTRLRSVRSSEQQTGLITE